MAYSQKQILGGISKELYFRFQKDLKKYRVGKGSSRGRKSVKVTAKGASKIQIEHLIHLMFSDMGVGKGTKFGKKARGSKLLGNSKKRKAKKWYSKNFRWAQLRIAERLLENATNQSIEAVLAAIPKTIELHG